MSNVSRPYFVRIRLITIYVRLNFTKHFRLSMENGNGMNSRQNIKQQNMNNWIYREFLP